ncbi:MAG TPA: alpha/beta hydrolase-fold protein, partial [Clostridia bacterium]|nr:alpha/beta hydrolase-fold protein [Clostridia bacterium]
MTTTSVPENQAHQVGERFVLHSKILKEDRPYMVYLPPSYNNRKFLPQKYPVLYLLDGHSHLPWATGVVYFMSAGINFNYRVPEMIIVAVPNTDRMRDLTPTHAAHGFSGKADPSLASSGGGDNFLNFLQEELIPHIESEYRTQPYRILAGHSLGGLFTLHTMLSRPQLFQAYVAMDPSIWWDDQLLVRRAEAMKTNEFRGPLYISISQRSPKDPGPTVHEIATQHFIQSLRTNGFPGFRASYQYFESENHVSMPLLSLYYGLHFIFDGYSPSGDEWDKPALLSAHFKQVSEKLGYSLLPPEKYIDDLGSWQLDSHDTNSALACFQLNVSNYPGSFNAWQSLGRAFKILGDTNSALDCF